MAKIIDMLESITSFLSTLPPEFSTAVLATMPIAELRAALPIGRAVFGLSPTSAYFSSIIGNLVPILIIYWLFPPILKFAKKKSKWLDTLLEDKVRGLEKMHKESYDRFGLYFLALLVAVPLPGSGVWTGTLVAIIFDIEKKYAIPAIILGLVVSGVIVLLLTEGVISGLDFLLPAV